MKQPSLKNLDPLKIFIQADNFILAHHVLLMQRMNWLQATANAGIVLSAFASELYMKAFISLEGKKVPTWHDLNELFALIDINNRNRIERYWNTQVIKNEPRLREAEADLDIKLPRSLSEALVAGANTFRKIRYAYEDEGKSNTYVLDDLPACLRATLLDIMPEWRLVVGHLGT